MLAAELLPSVLPHVNAKIRLDGAGIVTLGAFEWLFFGVNSQVSLEGMFKLENLVAVFTGEYFKLGLTEPVWK